MSWSSASCAPRRLVATPASATPPTPPLFYALPASTPANEQPSGAVPLFEHESAGGEHAYATGTIDVTGYTRAAEPVAYVWESPIAVRLPVGDYLGELVASAGDDVCASAASATGTATVALDATASRSLGAELAGARWSAQIANRCIAVEGLDVELELPAGLHTVTLEVWDELDRRDTDTLAERVGLIQSECSRATP